MLTHLLNAVCSNGWRAFHRHQQGCGRPSRKEVEGIGNRDGCLFATGCCAEVRWRWTSRSVTCLTRHDPGRRPRTLDATNGRLIVAEACVK